MRSRQTGAFTNLITEVRTVCFLRGLSIILREDALDKLHALVGDHVPWVVGILLGIVAFFMPAAVLLALVYLFGPMPSLTESSTLWLLHKRLGGSPGGLCCCQAPESARL